MQPAQIKLRPDEKLLHHAKIQPPYFAGQIKRAMYSSENGSNCKWCAKYIFFFHPDKIRINSG